MTCLQSWQLVGRRNTCSRKQWLVRARGAGAEGVGLEEGLGLTEGDSDGEKPPGNGAPGSRGGEGGSGSVWRSEGKRASLYERWKKFSTLLLRMNLSEHFRRWS